VRRSESLPGWLLLFMLIALVVELAVILAAMLKWI
jgi:hypothetical protein